MIENFVEDDYLDWNYDFFRVHRVIPRITARDRRRDFKLKDLQVADLHNNPGFAHSILATLLVRMYDSLWVIVDSPQELIVSPGQKTMGSLAAFCHKTSRLKHPGTLSGADS
jgi:hypothetical protein